MQHPLLFIKNVLLNISFLTVICSFNVMADNVETEANKIFKQFNFAKSPTNQSLPCTYPQPPMIPGQAPTTMNASLSTTPMVPAAAKSPTLPPQPQDIGLSEEGEPSAPQKITLDADGSGVPADFVEDESSAGQSIELPLSDQSDLGDQEMDGSSAGSEE